MRIEPWRVDRGDVAGLHPAVRRWSAPRRRRAGSTPARTSRAAHLQLAGGDVVPGLHLGGAGVDDADLDAQKRDARAGAERGLGLVVERPGGAAGGRRRTPPAGSRSCPRPAGSAVRPARGRPRDSALGTAEPPQPISRSLCCRPARSGSTPCQMVGTPAVKVTPSSTISFARSSGCIIGPGNTSAAPAGGAGLGDAPRVGVEHRHDRHRDVASSPSPNAFGEQHGHGVQHRRAVRCRRRPWGCRWCPTCSTSRRPGSRP